jgi:hypothetical protein
MEILMLGMKFSILQSAFLEINIEPLYVYQEHFLQHLHKKHLDFSSDVRALKHFENVELTKLLPTCKYFIKHCLVMLIKQLQLTNLLSHL